MPRIDMDRHIEAEMRSLVVVGRQSTAWSCTGCGLMNRRVGSAMGACIYCDAPEQRSTIVLNVTSRAATPEGVLR